MPGAHRGRVTPNCHGVSSGKVIGGTSVAGVFTEGVPAVAFWAWAAGEAPTSAMAMSSSFIGFERVVFMVWIWSIVGVVVFGSFALKIHHTSTSLWSSLGASKVRRANSGLMLETASNWVR